jgi:hypothetical protein
MGRFGLISSGSCPGSTAPPSVGIPVLYSRHFCPLRTDYAGGSARDAPALPPRAPLRTSPGPPHRRRSRRTQCRDWASAYVVGVGLCAGRSPVLGVVHSPVSRKTWWAVRGGGVHGCPPVSPRTRRSGALPVLAWTQGHHVPRQDVMARVLRMGLESMSQRLLQLWSPLLSWIMLAGATLMDLSVSG